jgi:hypothetical protein
MMIAPQSEYGSSNPIQGINFILDHFKEQTLFPRTISTYSTNNRQVTVYDKNSILKYFKAANYLDCRINAYPSYTNYKGINRQAPNFIMCDFDLKDFDYSQKRLDTVLKKSLRKINQDISGFPTVLWTGNGYHLYQPLEGFVLEELDIFSEFIDTSDRVNKDLSTIFMRFAEDRFSNSKYDHNNNPSIKSCMIRVPGTLNSKCVNLENGTIIKDPSIKIIHGWDGNRPKINWLLHDFRRSLINEKLKVRKLQNKNRKRGVRQIGDNNNVSANNTILWIEKLLLQTPIGDYRKTTVSLILRPI